MECNKDDALKAKELAEKKLLERDLTGAKIFAMKAQDMYPNLDGLPQLLATIDVYVSAEKKINGEVDWYSVLGVQPIADEQTIRIQYKKLALNLHPDKNKSVGADEAFKLITQAWSLLSDKAKKFEYDQKHNLSGIHQPVPGGKPSVPACQNGSFNNSNASYWNRDQRSATHPSHTTGSFVPMGHTFWTMCRFCRSKIQYDARYMNCTLTCGYCGQLFLAFDVSPPLVYRNGSPTMGISQTKQNNINSGRMEVNYPVSERIPMSRVNSSVGSGPCFYPGGSGVRTSVSTAAEAPGVFRMPSDSLKRPWENSTPVVRKEAHIRKTNNAANRTGATGCSDPNSVPKASRPMKKCRRDECSVNSSDLGRNTAARYCKPDSTRELSQKETKQMLSYKTRNMIHTEFGAWIASLSRKLDKAKNIDTEVREKDKKKATNGVKPDVQEFVDSDTNGKMCFSADAAVADSISMSVPDPDFHDFDGDRIEKAFGKNQVWAVYDADDGMPRYYVLIHNVVSKKPFQMTISWLNCKSNDELAPIKWVSSGFPKTSGDFRIGKHTLYSSLNSFSHRVNWTKGLRGAVNIYPKKGDVWAVYRNWSLDWNELTDDETIHKYDMVEVLQDFNEQQGVTVAPLVKVAGFKTVFRRHSDPRKIRNIPKAEMFCLSHQVPSYMLTGEEGNNAPTGCLELDPAAMPMELLQVGVEAPEQENFMEDGLEERIHTTNEEGSAEDVPMKDAAKAMGTEGSKPEIKYVYKRRRLREKRAM